MTGSHPLDAEWVRLELLTRALISSREGVRLDESLLDQLGQVQEAVEHGRGNGAWSSVAELGLERLDRDVLAAALAPEVRPALGWQFAALQPAGQPYPTPALVQELLVLDGAETGELYGCLGEAGKLRSAGLLDAVDDGPYATLRPTPRARQMLLGWEQSATPPGSVRVTRSAGWDDLVLPRASEACLMEFLAAIRHRGRVARDWGGHVGGGPVALFCGPPGTGKTFAAAVIASELNWPLYRVDLGRLVSKYIGETEKNLNRLFESTHARAGVLQFDEADSLFGKRGEIRDARDRYANLEVSHLLTRIEQHEGPCILTTNMRRHLDAGFSRRFQVVVEFPRPDRRARAEIWARVLPPRAPISPDLDLDDLAAAPLSGGGIHNAAMHAAFLAAEAGGGIGRREAAVAIWRELGKDGREVPRSALGALAEHLPAELAWDPEAIPA